MAISNPIYLVYILILSTYSLFRERNIIYIVITMMKHIDRIISWFGTIIWFITIMVIIMITVPT